MKRSQVDRSKLSPMMNQYMEIKDNYEEELLFYRLGDFYELFFEDGLTASKELELTLTGRNAGLEEKVPMCGVPHHAVKTYIEKLINKGYKVAICEQLEDPRETKGMVKRGVVDVISKGTIADLELLNKYDNSYIASLLTYPDSFLLTLFDISTGKLISVTLDKDIDNLISEINHYSIKELVLKDNEDILLIESIKNNSNISVDYSNLFDIKLNDNLKKNITSARIKMGVEHLFYFLTNKQLKDISDIKDIEIIDLNDYLAMNIHTIRNLELTETIRNKEREYSLLWFLDKCQTAMGSRKLKNWILNPIRDVKILNKRYDMIEKLNTEFIIKDELIDYLKEVYDIERLTGKLTNGSINGRDLLQLKNSLSVLPHIKDNIKKINFSFEIDTFEDIYNLLDKSISENAPIGLKEGGLIKEGYNSKLDELKDIRSGGKKFISSFEQTIKEQTGIKNLKIGFNKVFGYYIEISKGKAQEMKDTFGWERRQTLTNYERFISPELKEKESLILNAEEKIIDLEYNLFIEIKEYIKKYVYEIRKTADELATLDVILSLSKITDDYNLVRPNLNTDNILEIIGGRHPVVELVNSNKYVDNDCIMDKDTSTLLITGPNMSGKSTFMRQVAITIIMAQIGSFVPCKKANLPIIDKIFTRIGASDDLVGGRSTFMVEMLEANNALEGATKDSLILFDELGRGTATYDGMALARAILEYINDHIKCKTLFSTHYHELTEIDKKYKSIRNVHVDATLEDNKLIFLHKVKSGSIDKSYGIHVAMIAGLKNEITDNAEKILNEYENNSKVSCKSSVQLSLDFEEPKKSEKADIFEGIDPNNMTPIEALNKLYELIDKNNE